MATKPKEDLWCVMQQGGTTTEWYAHFFDTEQLAEAGKLEHEEASYNATDPIRVPLCLVETQNREIELNDLLARVASACTEIA